MRFHEFKTEDNSDKGMNKYGLAARNKEGKFYSYRHGKLTGTFDNMSDLQKHQHDLIKNEDAGDIGNEIAKMYDTAYEYINDSSDNPSDIESDYKFGYNDDDSMEAEDLAAAFRKDLKTGMALQKQLQAQREKEGREGDWDPFNPESMYHNELKALMSKNKGESIEEGADFYGYYKDPKDPAGKTMTYPDGMEFKTPHRSNANARMLLSRIGLDPDFENTGSTPIDDFIAATDKYLRMNVSDKDNPYYDEVEMYDMEAKRFKKEHPEITHVGFN